MTAVEGVEGSGAAVGEYAAGEMAEGRRAVKGPLGVGLILAGASALLAFLLPMAWRGIRKWHAGRLTPEEKQLLRCAYKSQGMINYIEADQIPGGWLRAGGVDFDTDPLRAALYREALVRLVALGHVEEETEHLFVLTHSGWKHTKKRPVL